MTGYTLRKEQFDFTNHATGDKWDIIHEEYQLLDNQKSEFKVYYTASFILPELLESEVKVTEPLLNIIPPVLQGFMEEGEADGLDVSQHMDIPMEHPVTRLTFKGSAVADTYEELEKQRVALYRDIIMNIHRYNILGALPPVIRRRIKDGSIPY